MTLHICNQPLRIGRYATDNAEEYAQDAYHDEIKFLNGWNVGLDGIDMQCHFAKHEALTPIQTLRG